MSKPIVNFKGISQDRWNLAFGNKTDEQRKAEREQVLAEQKKREQEEAQARADAAGLAVHDDRLYTGFNVGLGEYCRGRTHTREIAKRLGKRACG